MGVLGGVLKDLWQRIGCHEKGKKRREWKSEECLENQFILLQRREKLGVGWPVGPLGRDTAHACTWRGWPTTFPCTKMHKHCGLGKDIRWRGGHQSQLLVYLQCINRWGLWIFVPFVFQNSD